MLASFKRFAAGLDFKAHIRACEEWWFDASRHVKTAGNALSPNRLQVVGEIRDSYMYAPVRPANARAALRDLPLPDYSQYSFVDLGSGKGRVLFIAAEYPFRRVIGVEFAANLHQAALENIAQYRHPKRRCVEIESILANAAEFEFPNSNLILYLFNPFGPEIMRRMLANLEASLEKHPRHALVVLQWPQHADLVARMAGVRVHRQTRRYHTYEFGAEARNG